VQSILHRKRLLHPIAARALLGAIACGLFVVTLELARCPQLVAFAPVAQPVQLSAEAARGADAVYPANPHRAGLASGFYAMQAKAEMPMTPFLKPSAGRARASLKTSAVGVLRTSSEPGIANAHLRAQGPEQHAVRESGSRAPNEQQQWIFFTSWEQVESAATDEKSAAPAKSLAEKTGTTADYDTGASSAASSGSAPTNASSAARRIRVTQLIFKVLPANSQSSRTAAIPIGDGWIVIQL